MTDYLLKSISSWISLIYASRYCCSSSFELSTAHTSGLTFIVALLCISLWGISKGKKPVSLGLIFLSCFRDRRDVISVPSARTGILRVLQAYLKIFMTLSLQFLTTKFILSFLMSISLKDLIFVYRSFASNHTVSLTTFSNIWNMLLAISLGFVTSLYTI